MSKMKYILRKLHIGGGGAIDGRSSGAHHHRPVSDPRPATSSKLMAPIATSSASSSSSAAIRAATAEPEIAEAPASEGGTAAVAAAVGDFSFFEEEYQVQLALAISSSDPDGLEDPDAVQMKAAKQISLGCAPAAPSEVNRMEYLSVQYWNYNVVDYDEKLMDGFYDVYAVMSGDQLQGQMPSLVDLQAVSITDNVEYEVVVVDRTVDHALQNLEKRALGIASEGRVAQAGPIASHLVQKLANLVVDNMGGPVTDTEDILRRWRIKSHELRSSLKTIVLPLGSLEIGLSRHRALLFKVLADRVNLPCRLLKGSYYTGTDEGAVNYVKVDYDSEFIIDLMGAPGTLIPAEVPSRHLHESGLNLVGSSAIQQTVKDLCLALDNMGCEVDRKSGIMQGSLSENLGSECVVSPFERLQVDGSTYTSQPYLTDKSENDHAESIPLEIAITDISQVGESPSAEQMKVNDVSKYVVTAARNPDFAQKLRSVLLESGASPPPNLFSDLNPSDHQIEQASKESMCVRKKDCKLPQDNLSLVHQPFLILSSEGESSNCKVTSTVQAAAEASGVSTRNVSNFSLIRYRDGFSQDSSLDVLEAPKDSEGMAEQQLATENISDCCNRTSSDSSKQVLGTSNEDLPGSYGASNQKVCPVLDVSEREIPWEDLQIGERIGIGSFGEVYRADWNGTEVAVKKFLDQDLSGDALEQFRSEVKIMSRVRHPNVVLFMGAVTRPPNLSILTEFLPRGSLYRLLHRSSSQLDEKRRLRMAMDVAKGMNYLHSSHPTIVHRDLKSPNLLVDKNWVVKVCDFGLSRLKHHTFLSSKSTAGTPEWMAPEILRNERSNEKCDVYSFGVILWELTTLRTPWSGMNPMQVVGAVGFQNRRLDIPKEVDPKVADIISSCWLSEPSERPSFAQLLSPLKQLQRLLIAND